MKYTFLFANLYSALTAKKFEVHVNAYDLNAWDWGKGSHPYLEIYFDMDLVHTSKVITEENYPAYFVNNPEFIFRSEEGQVPQESYYLALRDGKNGKVICDFGMPMDWHRDGIFDSKLVRLNF